MIELNISTSKKEEIIDITNLIEEIISKSDIEDGFVYIYCPHTTAGLMINENADDNVKHDIIISLNDIVKEMPKFKHSGGNSAAHVKSALVGKSLQIAIEEGRMVLGTWDGIMFCEFDGPRNRKINLRLVEE